MGVALLGLDLDFGFLPALQPHPAGQRRGGGIKTWKGWEEFGPPKKIKKTPDFIALKKFLEHE